MIRLQDAVDEFSQEQLERDDRFHLPSPGHRHLLADINLDHGKHFGEGEMVTLAGFVISARHPNVGSGESVNCGEEGLRGQ